MRGCRNAWDGGASFRRGARFGLEAIRSASGMIRTFNSAPDVQVFGELSTIDYGDSPTVPGYIEDAFVRIESFISPLARGEVTPVGTGGDHSTALAELRALARIHGPLGLVHFDSHTDLWESYFGRPYSHGTMFRRALEEGILDATRVMRAAMHGPLYGVTHLEILTKLGAEMMTWSELSRLEPTQFASRVQNRIGAAPAFLSFDVDFVDAAVAPGTGTPQVGGPASFEALFYLRSVTQVRFVGFDVVEVSPIYYDAGQVTALLAANVIFDMLAMVAGHRARS